jgi:hypothetical protein
LEEGELVIISSGGQSKVFLYWNCDGHPANRFDCRASRNEVKPLVASVIYHLDGEFRNPVSPQWDASRSFLQRMKADTASYGAINQVDA